MRASWKIFLIILGIVLLITSAYSLMNNLLRNKDQLCGGLAEEFISLTLPAMEERCKALGGLPSIFVIREVNDLNTPLVSVMCLKENWSGG